MRIVLSTLIWFGLSSYALAAPLQHLTKYLVSHTGFENPTANTWDAGDDTTSNAIDIGFTFRFNNTNYTQIYVNANGIIIFGSQPTNGHYNNSELPYTASNFDHSIYPYWDDLYRRNGTIKYETLGNASNRHFVIKWNHVKHYSNSGNYTFEVVLYEDGAIRFRYADDADGTSYNGSDPGATIGVQESSSNYDEHSYNGNPIINQNQDILYIPNPIQVNGTNPTCPSPVPKITLNTYTFTGSHPNDAGQFQSAINTYATEGNLHGSGYIDDIHVTQNNNNDPYHSGTDSDYMSLIDGYIYFPESGIYKFGIDGDDAIEIYIDGNLVTGWYGGHWYVFHATRVKYVEATQGWHRISYHHEERSGDDGYHLYWQRPSEDTIDFVPSNYFYHCPPSISKISCVISDPVNNTNNPKRIPGATIRYAIEVNNDTPTYLSNAIVEDNITTAVYDLATITSPKVTSGGCANCTGLNGTASGSVNGNSVKIDYGMVAAGVKECGYFDVDIK